MEIPESLLMELCNAREDVGTLTERLVWIQSQLDTYEEYERGYPLMKARLEIVEAQLASSRETLKKLYKEIYG